jgi:hypothetical protein
MANALITPSIIAKEAIVQLENNLVMGNKVHRDYKEEFVKVGDTISIRQPVQFDAVDGATLSVQDVEEATTSITIDQRKHVGWQFGTQDLTLTIEDYSERYIKPAMIALAQQVETSLTGLYKDTYFFAGTPGTTPSTFAHLGEVGEIMDEVAMGNERCAVHNPSTAWSLANGLTGVFVQEKAKTAYEEAMVGRYARLDNYMGQSIQTHTVGAHGGTPLVNGASQNVTYAASKNTRAQDLVTDGWDVSTQVLNEGDIFTIAGVFSVNPITKSSTGRLQTFVANEDGTSDGAGALTVNVSPAIITSGPYQTVSAVPADDAAITVKGTASTGYAQNLAFHKNAYALVTTPLAIPDGVSFSARESHKGLSIRVVKDYDIVNDVDKIRLDILYGVKAIDPRQAVRLTA